MSNYVFVIDTNKTLLNPTTPAKARWLLNNGHAAVYRRYPFTIILKKVVEKPQLKPIELKIDPGSKTTGIALVQKDKVIWGANLKHRGQQIKLRLSDRVSIRKNRRSRKTRYRPARFLNRTRTKGWLAPSLNHRVLTTMTWVNRIKKYCNVTKINQELVRFDLQKLENPEIAGTEYQQGTLFGYEVRNYLLEKWNRQCAYCQVQNVPLQIEHIVAKSKGGTNRISNLCLACEKCNQRKGNQDIKDFLKGKSDLLKKILSQTKATLKDAAAVNSTRWKLFSSLKQTGLIVTTSSGGQTKYNRARLGLDKDHWLDAAVSGNITELTLKVTKPLLISCKGHGSRQYVRMNKYGFPASVPKDPPTDWSTGDIVDVIGGKNSGLKSVRIKSVRKIGYFTISSKNGKKYSASRKDIKCVYRNDGYSYNI